LTTIENETGSYLEYTFYPLNHLTCHVWFTIYLTVYGLYVIVYLIYRCQVLSRSI